MQGAMRKAVPKAVCGTRGWRQCRESKDASNPQGKCEKEANELRSPSFSFRIVVHLFSCMFPKSELRGRFGARPLGKSVTIEPQNPQHGHHMEPTQALWERLKKQSGRFFHTITLFGFISKVPGRLTSNKHQAAIVSGQKLQHITCFFIFCLETQQHRFNFGVPTGPHFGALG